MPDDLVPPPQPIGPVRPWRVRVSAMGWGAAGVLLAILLLHLWYDHVALHQLVNMVNSTAAQQAGQTAPPAK